MCLLRSAGLFFFKNVFGTYFCWALRDHQLEYISICPQRTHHFVWGLCVGFQGHSLLWLPGRLLGFSAGSSVDVTCGHHMTVLLQNPGNKWFIHKRSFHGPALCRFPNQLLLIATKTADTWLLYGTQIRGVKMPINHCQAHVQVNRSQNLNSNQWRVSH